MSRSNYPPPQGPPPPYSGPPPGSYGIPQPPNSKVNPYGAPHNHDAAYGPPKPAPQQMNQPYGAQPFYGAQAPYGAQQNGNYPRTLHIYSSSRHWDIKDSDKSTLLYSSTSHSFHKPNMEIRAPNGSVIGTVTFHSFSSTIDLTLHGQSIAFDSNGTFHSGHHMISYAPASGGSLKWKNDGAFTSDKRCFDAHGNTVAIFEKSGFALTKEGRLQLHGPAAAPGPLMDEVVLSAIAEIEHQERQSSAASGGGGGGA